MKKLIFSLALIAAISLYNINAQSFDWNLRGGVNIQDSKTTGKDIALWYHAGAQAGVRVASLGFYGEALYSIQENQYGGDPVSYFSPAVLMKGFTKKFVFVEMGATMMSLVGDPVVANDILNPDGEIFFFAGLGFKVSRIEISFRSHLKQSYSIIRATAAVKF